MSSNKFLIILLFIICLGFIYHDAKNTWIQHWCEKDITKYLIAENKALTIELDRQFYKLKNGLELRKNKRKAVHLHCETFLNINYTENQIFNHEELIKRYVLASDINFFKRSFLNFPFAILSDKGLMKPYRNWIEKSFYIALFRYANYYVYKNTSSIIPTPSIWIDIKDSIYFSPTNQDPFLMGKQEISINNKVIQNKNQIKYIISEVDTIVLVHKFVKHNFEDLKMDTIEHRELYSVDLEMIK